MHVKKVDWNLRGNSPIRIFSWNSEMRNKVCTMKSTPRIKFEYCIKKIIIGLKDRAVPWPTCPLRMQYKFILICSLGNNLKSTNYCESSLLFLDPFLCSNEYLFHHGLSQYWGDCFTWGSLKTFFCVLFGRRSQSFFCVYFWAENSAKAFSSCTTFNRE